MSSLSAMPQEAQQDDVSTSSLIFFYCRSYEIILSVDRSPCVSSVIQPVQVVDTNGQRERIERLPIEIMVEEAGGRTQGQVKVGRFWFWVLFGRVAGCGCGRW